MIRGLLNGNQIETDDPAVLAREDFIAERPMPSLALPLPETFIVGTLTYRIESKETVFADDRLTVCWAHCSSIDQVIQVQEGMTAERMRAAFLHELLHAIDDGYGNIGLTEDQVTRLGFALAALFTQNDMRFLLPEAS